MLTFDGTCVAPQNLNAPSLEAIALSLGRMPRWAGQTATVFPVLAHSFLVSTLIGNCYPLAHPARATMQLHALLHDAAEAVVGDIPSTWKTEADRVREHLLMVRIYEALGIVDLWPLTPDAAEAVAAADHLALRCEATVLMPHVIAMAPYGPVQPIYAETEQELMPAVEHCRQLAASCRRYPIWVEAGSERQVEYCRQVRCLIDTVSGRQKASGRRACCPDCRAALANDGSVCDRCGWVRA